MAAQRILIDSSLIIDFFRKQDKEKSLLYRLFMLDCELYISSLTFYKLQCGATTDLLQKDTDNLLSLFYMLDFGVHEAMLAAKSYRHLKKTNQRVDAVDILIAATAMSHSLRIATLNRGHFARFAELEFFEIS